MMTRYEREERIEGEWLSLYHSDDLEDSVRYVKAVHTRSGNRVRVTQIPGRQGTISETVFEIPERAAFLPCPHCGSTSVELKESKAVHSYHFRVSCLSCADEGFEVAVGGRYVEDWQVRPLVIPGPAPGGPGERDLRLESSKQTGSQ